MSHGGNLSLVSNIYSARILTRYPYKEYIDKYEICLIMCLAWIKSRYEMYNRHNKNKELSKFNNQIINEFLKHLNENEINKELVYIFAIRLKKDFCLKEHKQDIRKLYGTTVPKNKRALDDFIDFVLWELN